MIDINELRRLVQAAISKMNARDPEFASSVTPLAVLELLDRLEGAESECLEQARLNGMGASREATLLAKLEAAEKEVESLRQEIALRDAVVAALAALAMERDALRAKITEIEKQEPVGKFIRHPSNWLWEQDGYGDNPDARPLYALPGAQEQEPTHDWWDCLIADISAIDCMYRGSPTYAHDAYWMRDHVVLMLKKRRDALLGAQGND